MSLQRHTKTLLALCLCVTPTLAGVLPEDRADAFYHRYQGGGITVQGPSVLIQKKVTDNFAVNYNFYQDYITSASIDVKLSASQYKEQRTQHGGGFQYLHGKSTYSAGIINSSEPDYKSNTSYYSISQDMFGDLTTLTMTYKRGWDKVYRDIKDANGRIVNDPRFGNNDLKGPDIPFRDADHRGYAVGISQILTRSLIASFNYGYRGFQQSYRTCTPAADLAIRRYLDFMTKDESGLEGDLLPDPRPAPRTGICRTATPRLFFAELLRIPAVQALAVSRPIATLTQESTQLW